MWDTICRMKPIRIYSRTHPGAARYLSRNGSGKSFWQRRRPNLLSLPFREGWRAAPGWVLTLLLALPAGAAPDLPNFHPAAPGIWRGGAPTEAGLAHLKAMGVRTVIDLRISPKLVKREGQEARALGFHWINLPMGADPPTPKQVSTFLATLKRAPGEPVYVHCQHGADRTGCMLGIYRVTQQGWTFPQAYAEMRRDGFNPRWGRLREAVQLRAKPKKETSQGTSEHSPYVLSR